MIKYKEQYENFAGQILGQVEQQLFGVEDVVRLCVVALYTEGHVLLEGNPGLGKTALVRRISEVLRFPFGRIQFTPDLMPSDITGTLMPRTDGAAEGDLLQFRQGPLFTSILLADEINRATPKTQAAMLEAMAERQVTVLGETYRLDGRNFRPHTVDGKAYPAQTGRPFMVLATQNPIDHEGTYALPEAQSDRFMFKILMPVPDASTLHLIIAKVTGGDLPDDPGAAARSMLPPDPVKATQQYRSLTAQIKEVDLSREALAHITALFMASNRQYDALPERVRRDAAPFAEVMTYGLGPRAATALSAGAKAWTLFFTRGNVERADAASLAHVLIPALRHRLKLDYGWDDGFGGRYASIDRDRRLDHFLADFCIACAPDARGYKRDVEKTLADILTKQTA